MGTLSEKLKFITEQLSEIYPPHEAENIGYLLLESYGISKTDIRLDNQKVIDTNLLDSHLKRLLAHEPIQHVIGKAHFYGFDVVVNQHTLVPRRETEELVHLIIKEHKNNSIKLLDIGTGSGIIPIGIKLNLPQADVWAMDVSDDALKVANENATELVRDGEIHFVKDDILNPELSETFDVIVSNPPYITEAEKALMDKNVLDFDPHLALFVPDNDPLMFYRAIAKFCTTNLKQGGKLYVEINEAFGLETAQLFEEFGLTNTEIIKDMQGKDRIVTAIK